ncbi:MAG: NADH-quinone oxidoreductase subunit NuoN [Rhodobiaceae bacterium]|nr:NADH-quinone oxidoreductase subunit NuoN [Rhodobiaceae bacterium]MCC0013075.1 NADH-quinone oxidoreductase subunit NuoN [Rhodobiaceae bacterium]MCC0062272.1 NADH-quinone oxidoreductase subunit NuoN [Rhodobiaceae bacterium]
MTFTSDTLVAFSPEILLAVGAMVLLMIGAFRDDGALGVVTGGAIALIVTTLALVHVVPSDGLRLFGNSIILDGFAKFLKTLTLIGSAAAVIMSIDWMRSARMDRFEYPVLIVLATLGMMIMISAGDLIALYMGIELQSLALYVVASIQRDSTRSTEAGLKYFALGALSSGMLLYGCSLIYGFSGTIELAKIATLAGHGEASVGLVFGLVFLIAGLAFKVSAVPFHMWTPDVYEGAPTPVTAFFASAPKIAGMAVFVRAMISGFPTMTPEWQQVIVFVSIASMVLGAFAAIGQRNIKRLMAYSSIGHMGYALVGLASGSESGVKGVIIYLTLYLAMTLGTFACILAMRRNDAAVEEIDDLAGLSRNSPLMAFVLAMLLFSLAGIPPLAGFFAKFYVFLAAVEAGLYPLAVIGVVASVVGAYYYLRIVKIIYFDEPAPAFDKMSGELATVLAVSGVVVILFFVYPGPLVSAATAAAKALF